MRRSPPCLRTIGRVTTRHSFTRLWVAQPSSHSHLTLTSPRKDIWRKPQQVRICPKTGTTVCAAPHIPRAVRAWRVVIRRARSRCPSRSSPWRAAWNDPERMFLHEHPRPRDLRRASL